VLKEYVNRQWTNELLSYPFEAETGACHVESVRLDGPGGPVPVQVSGVTFWPGTQMVRSAVLWFVADLAPLAEDAYTVHYAPTPVAIAVTGDLATSVTADQFEMTTSRFGARLRLGAEVYGEPRDSSAVSAPVVALRLADGTWFGGSRAFGNTKLTAWSAELVAKGPVFGEVAYTYRYEDRNVVTFTLRLSIGSPALHCDTTVAEDRPEDGVDLILSAGLPPLTLIAQREAYADRPAMKAAKWSQWVKIPLATHTEELVTNLSPWADWWNTWTQTSVRLHMAGERELHIASRDPGAWVTPAAPGTMRDWAAWQHKLLPVRKGSNGEIFLRINNAAGIRKWSVEDREQAYAEARRMSRAQVKAEWPPLNEVKDWILEWPGGPDALHPHLFVSAADVARHQAQQVEQDPDITWLTNYLSREAIRPVPSYKDAQAMQVYVMTKGDPDATAKTKLYDRARQHLGALGDFDKMRCTQTVAALYDLIMGTDLITSAEKRLYRSQMAFLGYMVARPSTWNIERGYRSYNPNMSLSYLLARGTVAAAIPTHPLAKAWVAPGLARAKAWLKEVGPEGEWYESAHYSQVSAFAMTSFAVALKQAGFEDLFLNENLKRWAMWLAQIYTPRDPMPGRGKRRATPPIGRATAGVPWGLFGLMAKATRDTDPAYASTMQWAWAGTDYTLSTANHLGGFECVYMDRDAPMATPAWRSKLFPQVGPLFRNGVGGEHENYLALHANKGAGVRPSELGCIAMWFARGVPIAGSFPGGYKERHQLLISRVIPAMSWSEGQPWDETRFGCDTDVKMGPFSALPRQDCFTANYVHKGWKGGRYGIPKGPVSWPPVPAAAGFPVAWQRRMLYIRDDAPEGLNYLILRDSVQGGKPSLWQMWTATEKIGTPAQVQDLDAFLADSPGKTPVPAHELQGNRLTAVGRFGVDVEYYIASPAEARPWTMHWSQHYVDYSVTGDDYRDLLQLRLDGDGEYFVAMFPRFRTESAPVFTAMGDGTVIKISGKSGTDYCFLPGKETDTQADDAHFRGTVGSVQDRQEDLVLATGAAGEVGYHGYAIAAPQAASLRIAADTLVVRLSYDARNGGTATLKLTGRWRLAPGQAGVTMTTVPGGYKLMLAAGVTQAELEQE